MLTFAYNAITPSQLHNIIQTNLTTSPSQPHHLTTSTSQLYHLNISHHFNIST
ncbi:MAG: hypothetical protein MRZ33_04445 [Prevotella sp.]|nr:hypothetical protein [Prevotella sp.]MDY5369433.1 hypothetical protein [Prevotella sp.]